MKGDWSAFIVTPVSLLSPKIFLTINTQEGDLAVDIMDIVEHSVIV